MFIDRLNVMDEDKRKIRVRSRFLDWATGLALVPLNKRKTLLVNYFESRNKIMGTAWVMLNLRVL